TLLEDGIPIAPAPYSAPAAYYFPLITRMTQVRVIKGPSAISEGPQSIGGAVDMIARPIPSGEGGGVDVSVGQFGYGKVHVHAGTRGERLGVLVEGVHLRSDGWKELPGGAGTGFARNEWMARGAYDLSPESPRRHELAFKATYSDEVSNETYLGLTDDDFRKNSRRRYPVSELDRMSWHRTGVSFTHRVEPSRSLAVETTLYRSDLSRTWRKVNEFAGASLYDVLRDPDGAENSIFAAVLRGELDSSSPAETLLIGPNRREFVSQGVQSRVTWASRTGPLAHRVEYGIRLHNDRVERRQEQDGFQSIGGALVATGAPTEITAWNEAYTDAVALHATDAVTFRGLTVTPGARVELLRAGQLDRIARTRVADVTRVFLPGVGVYQSITEELGLLGGVYQGFSPKAPGDRTVEVERSVNTELGARYTSSRATAQVVGFQNDYSNLTDVCTVSSGCVDASLDRQFDAGRARIRGVEANAQHEPVALGVKWPVAVAYTFTLTEFLRTFESEDPIFGQVRAGDEMPYVPRHQLFLTAGVQGDRAGGYVAATHVSAMREQPGRGGPSSELHTDSQLTFDAGGSVKLPASLELYGSARNLLGSEFIVSRRPFGARPNAPRTLQIGLKARF
ncbi:MAG: TonB-dependent receptor, partial [Deltaproteobacteria bacterium]|nr:TonB-dependent receptor [Deltaproteobacteria bacterium]